MVAYIAYTVYISVFTVTVHVYRHCSAKEKPYWYLLIKSGCIKGVRIMSALSLGLQIC